MTAERFKRPEYTGENRCVPCTVVNGLIAVLGSGLFGLGAFYVTGSVPVAVGTAGVLLSVSVCLIYLRGYLVPGTPALTKQYAPAWLLDLFGKAPATGRASAADTDVDPAELLRRLGVLEPCETGDDLCLETEFRSQWTERMATMVDDDDLFTEFVGAFDLDERAAEFVDHGDAVQLSVDGAAVGTWESHAAVVADASAVQLVACRDAAWDRRPAVVRSTLLKSLRLFLESCPDCGNALQFGEETVESCCSTHEIYALECTACDARLFESGPTT